MPKPKDAKEKGRARKKFSRLLDLERPQPDLIGAFAGDRDMSPAEKKAMAAFRKRTAESFYTEIIFTLTHKYYSNEEAKKIWGKVLEHKELLAHKLNRNPGVVVATLDYLANVREEMESPAMITAPEITTIAEVALHDGLTGLFDHSTFFMKLQLEIDRHRRYRSPVSVIMADIDDFKTFNDTFGHRAGDDVLVRLARILEEETRDLDVCARYGGEEFAVILPQTGQRRALGTAERVRARVEKNFRDKAGTTVSLGVATCPLNASDAEMLVQKADENLYRSKKAGKNRVTPES